MARRWSSSVASIVRLGLALAALPALLGRPALADTPAAAATQPPTSAGEPAPEADFKAANERVLSGDDAGAIALYQHLQSRGVVASDLEYNLGVALARQDRSLDAIIAWERALRLDPSRDDASANLAALRQRLPTRAAPTGDSRPASAVDAIAPAVAPLSRDGAAWALAGALALSCALIALRRLGVARGRGPAVALVVALVATAASGLVVTVQDLVVHDGRAVVLKSGQLKEGAHQRFSDVAAIAAGERVRVLREESGWVEVQATDGVTGWMARGAVLPL